MNRCKLLIVALTRFSGILMAFYGLVAATYVVPYYHRYLIVYERPLAHDQAGFLFWLAILQAVLRVLVGWILFARAESIIGSLGAPEPDASVRSLIVALVKLNGFLLLFYGAASAVSPDTTVFNFLHDGGTNFRTVAPTALRVSVNLLAGFLVVVYADQIIGRLERWGPREIAPPGQAEQA
jgi:hypothetical protein